ncbi:hypothetical protein WJM97_20165 [Okeanomitos corallinicola TIOX110]|uniref:Uncharacterized protein n=1 Tax=Okeanomitos corallinicola TIOX110 TaxID=3133117 RepID=A0ABZ2UQJ9_9CYAN
MKPNQIIQLTAFLTALTKLNEPLPENIQIKLNDIGKTMATDVNNFNVDIIAESYPILDKIYQAELTAIDSIISQRNKGLEPEPLPTDPTQELTNAAMNSFNDSNSVDAAKKVVNSSLLERVRKFIIGK